jgi:hypothetical protein
MLQTFVFSVWSFATQPENQLKKREIQKMMQIDFEDVHDDKRKLFIAASRL